MQFRKRAPTELDVNLVPLIDILMSVLIFLAVTTSYNKFTELQVQLPVANSEAIREYPKEIILYVSSDGRYAINREILQEHTPEGVARALTQAGITPESTLIISADHGHGSCPPSRHGQNYFCHAQIRKPINSPQAQGSTAAPHIMAPCKACVPFCTKPYRVFGNGAGYVPVCCGRSHNYMQQAGNVKNSSNWDWHATTISPYPCW